MHESQPQYVVAWFEGGLVGFFDGDGGDGDGGDGDDGFLVGITPPLTQVPLWHIPKGTELQGVESGKDG